MDIQRSISTKLQKIKENSAISDVDKAYVEKAVRFLQARDLNPRTILRWLDCLDIFLTRLGKKNVETATREDIESVVASINTLGYKEETKAKIKTIIKAFYKHFFGEDTYYPKQVAWIRTSIKQSRRILPEDMLTDKEVVKLLQISGNERDKAIIALLYDSGIRAGELLNMKVKDVYLAEEPTHILVNGKTGPRKIPILYSVPYLGSYLNSVSSKLKPSDYMWQNMAQSHIKGRLTNGGIAIMLRRLEKEGAFSKHIYPHLFRHSRATHYANKLTEQQLKEYFGWTGGSRMVATYVHLSGRNIDNAILEANGMKPKEEVGEEKVPIKECPKCKFVNGIEMVYCGRCGSPVDIKTAIETQRHEVNMKDAMAEVLNDPKAIEDVVHAYLLMQANKGKKKQD
jgi:integrase/recombinase XerD